MRLQSFSSFDAEKICKPCKCYNQRTTQAFRPKRIQVLGIKKYEDIKGNLENLQLKLRQDSASADEKKQLEDLKAAVAKFEIQITDKRK
ncbi:MAG: hypothetical protein U0T81_09070 [Saprospiraceae bacterium]